MASLAPSRDGLKLPRAARESGIDTRRGRSSAIHDQDTAGADSSLFARRLAGFGLLLLAALLLLALASHSALDPSFSHATGLKASNLLGSAGAHVSDVMLEGLGLAAWLPVLCLGLWGYAQLRGRPLGHWRWRLVAMVLASLLAASGLGLLTVQAGWPVSTGLGGLNGWLVQSAASRALQDAGLTVALWLPGLALLLLAAAALTVSLRRLHLLPAAWLDGTDAASDDLAEPGVATEVATPETSLKRRAPSEEEEDTPTAANVKRHRVAVAPGPAARPPAGKRVAREQQGALALGDTYTLPPLKLLTAAPARAASRIDRTALEQNARLLESVLNDYGVKGEITRVRPGPVVTLYELEPAPGIKSSRVIGLTDDIARSMSAISARVAVVPGRNVIGIELPNAERETVMLRELMETEAFDSNRKMLPLVLGKDISGEPVIADLSPMPHLLIAGTTGSGKSVGLNAMILSLLYRLSPEQCRLIMIDPKMLELKVYDGIPHLLAPVVIEPKKSIAALKWAVREMDARYKKMSDINTRNLAGFNDKVREARTRGKPIIRQFHTGYDQESGQPLYEEQRYDYDPMPMIVVVVDELADLMIVAGKEVEVLIQRLAQKARAAGIHLIMATQRPSVDVITGVIKANLPTRISFQVTSKIDSRTILGEQGAEQLLGKGDMLYMASGKQITRVHGPFVSDEEVEQVADYWRGQGLPDYVEGLTNDPEEDGEFGMDADGGAGGSEEDQLYRRGVQVVAEAQKASISYVQRQLRVGYNTAARLIERMESEGLVSPPDHVGRREVFIDRDGSRI